jgi:hypothetical protein
MNFSMQDTFNRLKLAAVLRKQSAPELLDSYSAERQVVAQELIRRGVRRPRHLPAAARPSGDRIDARVAVPAEGTARVAGL